MELWFGDAGVSRSVWLFSGSAEGEGEGEGEGDRVVVTTDRKKIIISPSPAIDSKPSDHL